MNPSLELWSYSYPFPAPNSLSKSVTALIRCKGTSVIGLMVTSESAEFIALYEELLFSQRDR